MLVARCPSPRLGQWWHPFGLGALLDLAPFESFQSTLPAFARYSNSVLVIKGQVTQVHGNIHAHEMHGLTRRSDTNGPTGFNTPAQPCAQSKH